MAPEPDTQDSVDPSHADVLAGGGTRVSSPVSTGGAGTFFEQHVGAYWLAQLLVRGFPPILHRSVVVEMHFQTEHLGWHTDDFLVVCESSGGTRARLAGQVKRAFTVSKSNAECKKAIGDFWSDFTANTEFNEATDRLVLVVLRGTNVLLDHFSGLLDCARAARSGAEFVSRLATPGFLNVKSARQCDELRSIVSDIEGHDVPVAGLWSFLRVLHVLSLDLNTPTAQHEALIKSLLALTSADADPETMASVSWAELLRIASTGMETASSLKREDLPKGLLQQHSAIGSIERTALVALADHSQIVTAAVHSALADRLHLGRESLVQQVLDQMDATQVVLISGPAGIGKSVIAKDAIGILSESHYTFAFRAEEFARAHLDETLHNSQVPANGRLLAATLASQGKKVMLVESVERLLEKATRDAFSDLLNLAAADKSWRIVLTCRDYSTELVRASLLGSVAMDHSVVVVPPLSNTELDEVQASFPCLSRPLADHSLRSILRNPYVLDKAMQIPWDEESSLPESEREFRTLFWSHVIRADHQRAEGMPDRRHGTFVEIALRRARALSPYAGTAGLDAEAVNSLRGDSLVVDSPVSNALVAPAHDVLEDWAILRWIEEQYAECEESAEQHARLMEPHPAIRRTYRKWVAELVDRDPDGSDRLFEQALTSSVLPPQARDDMLVSLLTSASAPRLLERRAAELLSNEKALLRRVIHLLRVACVSTPQWLGTANASLFNVPVGPAWPAVLSLVETHLSEFGDEDRLLLLGLIEDWSRGVAWWSPCPEGAEAAIAIAWSLLPAFNEHWSDEQRKRTLQVIAKVPKVCSERFIELLRERSVRDSRNHAAEDLRELVLEGLEGMPTARDLPDVLVDSALDHFLCSDSDAEPEWAYSGDLGLETLFGIKHARAHEFYPASAYHGPYISLLRYHPEVGTAFIVRVFNHSADWYAHPRVRSVEPPHELTLHFADGTERTQWCNARLWNLYRGTSVGPDVLQSLLMAFERWLLELAEAQPSELDPLLIRVLQQTANAAVTSIVASVATALPHLAGETLLVLLRSRVCIQLDRQRLVHESATPTQLASLFPGLPRNDIYKKEREEADRLPHRSQDLETAIVKLQLGSFGTRVQEVLDWHRAGMPPLDDQDEEDRIWRLALHRMDLRQYAASQQAEDASGAEMAQVEEAQRGVTLTLEVPDADLREMVDQAAEEHRTLGAALSLLNWAHSAFDGEQNAGHLPLEWRAKLGHARALVAAELPVEEQSFGRDGVGIVAAVCVRDHWDEMSDEEQLWCAETICSEVEGQAECWSQHARVQRYSMSANRSCAWVLPLLLGREVLASMQPRIDQALPIALTHPVDEVRWYAAWGIRANLWTVDAELASRCVQAVAAEASDVQRAWDAEMERTYNERRPVDEIEAEAAALVRERFIQGEISPDSYLQLDVMSWFGARAHARILAMLTAVPNEGLAVEAFQRATQTLVSGWDQDDDRSRGGRRRERDFENDSTITHILESYLLEVPPASAAAVLAPVLDAVDRHPREIALLLLGLVTEEDRQQKTAHFWSIWRLFSERVCHAAWVPQLQSEHAWGTEMIAAMFLGSYWKDGILHWRGLEGYAAEVDCLFDNLPPSPVVLDDYVRFLHQIGDRSLPAAFIRIADRLKMGDAQHMLSKANTVFLLEMLLNRYVYGRPQELKGERGMREAVLFLLDALVEQGSSAAFRMRDDFVTPLPE